MVLVGIGVVPNTGWLEGSGLTLDDGVVCDATSLAAPGVTAAGDVARWHSPRYGRPLRVEHWEHAIQHGEAAARRLLVDDAEAEPFDPVPWFWSDQYDRKIQLAGVSAPHDQVEVVIGSTDERRFVALYGHEGRVTAVLGMNRPRHVMQLRAARRAPHAVRRGRRRREGAGMNTLTAVLLGLTLAVAAVDWWAVNDPGRRRVELIAKPLTLVVLIGAALALDPVDPTVRAWFVARPGALARRRRLPDAATRSGSWPASASFLARPHRLHRRLLGERRDRGRRAGGRAWRSSSSVWRPSVGPSCGASGPPSPR